MIPQLSNRPLQRPLGAMLSFGLLLALSCSEDSETATPAAPRGSECGRGQARCDGVCVDLETDVAHCGDCALSCQTGQLCRSGACDCQSGLSVCDETCTDTSSDGKNCGSCGNACPTGQVCSQGHCADSCAQNLIQCGSSCVDTASSVQHCGSCNNACAAGQTCAGSACVCPSGQMFCAGQCVDTSLSVVHCGSCGNRCAPGASCSSGSCVGGNAGAGGTGGSDAGATGGNAGTGGTLGGAGMSGSGGASGSAGSGGSAGTGGSVGALTLSAIAANTTIGLDWSRISGATSYRVYYSGSPSVNPASAAHFDSTEPATVHRGLTNGSAYYYRVTAIAQNGESAPSNEVSATPSGEWVLEELGAGDFNDVLSGGRVTRLPIGRRVQILLLPDGYLASDLGVFHSAASHTSTRANDVDRWVDEVFGIEPFSLFREAFVVWYLPRASSARIGQGTTAFGVQISAGSVSTTSAAAAPLWSALDAQGGDAFLFPPAASVTNHVASFMIFDPARGRAGYSGLTTTLTNPASTQQRIRAAFAQGHAHEFGHAFSNVRDEYLELDNTVTSTTETSNVAHTNVCNQLPWAYLLAGAGINQTQNLVGAFGRPDRGYHSELHCLMNGTHDNGEFYCGAGVSLNLRVNDRMCNFCREITAYRVFDRTGLLPGTTGFSTWRSSYRAAFYQRFGFRVPTPVPQTFSCPSGSAQPLYEACVP